MLRSALCACLLAVIVVGCGGPRPRPADPNVAVETLRAALDAWQGGQTPDTLRPHAAAVSLATWRALGSSRGGEAVGDY